MLKTASGFPSDLGVNIPSAKEEMQVQYLHWEDPMEKKMATHSSIPAWEIPSVEEPGGIQFIGSQRVGHDLGTKQTTKKLLK